MFTKLNICSKSSVLVLYFTPDGYKIKRHPEFLHNLNQTGEKKINGIKSLCPPFYMPKYCKENTTLS